MTDRPEPFDWRYRHQQLRESMPGFDGLILAVQGLLVGCSLATGEIWVTPDVATTILIAQSRMGEIYEMTAAFGVEQ